MFQVANCSVESLHFLTFVFRMLVIFVMLPFTLNLQPWKSEVFVLWYISFDCPLCKGLPYDFLQAEVYVWFQVPSEFLSSRVCNCNNLAGNPVHDAGMNVLGRKEMSECEPEVLIHVSPNFWQISPQCRVWKERLGFMHFTDCGLKDFLVFFFFVLSSSAFFLWIPVWNFQPLVSIINHHLECPKHFHKNHHPPSHQVDHISAIQTNVNSSSDNTFYTPNESNLLTEPGAWTKP